ncbi:MAG TPA: hypothetical protein VM618_08845 [Acidimicrobiia bacterium]|nr:hypothetical protein [Acidimicrobiia bacterium]
MKSLTARAPDGSTWTVARRWTPRRKLRDLRWRREEWATTTSAGTKRADEHDDESRADEKDRSWLLDVLDPTVFFDDLPGGILAVIVIAAALVLFAFVVWPLLLVLFDVVVIVLLTLAGVVGRIVLRRPWIVEAEGSNGERHEYRVVGWRDSQRLVTDLAFALETGRPLPAASAS